MTGALALAASFATGWVAIALALVLSQRPRRPGGGPSLDLAPLIAAGAGDPPAPEAWAMRDGRSLPVRVYPCASPRTVILLLHGSGWSGRGLHWLALRLSAEAAVLVPDLRGQGPGQVPRGDVDREDRPTTDALDLARLARARFPGLPLLLAGHSSGGGLALRVAGGHGNREAAGLLDGLVLLAPFLGHRSPATRPRSGGWARPLLRRIVGLAMLGPLGTRLLGPLVTVEFALPRAVLDGPLAAEATPAWSWRLMRGMAPGADGRAAIAGLRGPVLVLAGEADEAFDPEGYRAAFAGAPAGVEVLPGLGHAGLLLDGAVAARILALASGLSPGGPPSPAPPPIPRA